MTKKDFELIATTIAEMRELTDEHRLYVAREFSYRLAQANSRFNSPRFVAACTTE